MTTTSKVCRDCKLNKLAEFFSISARYKDGLHTYCKTCMNRRATEWQRNNPERAKAIKKANRKPATGARAAQQKWTRDNWEQVKAYQREYQRKQVADWRANNPVAHVEATRRHSLYKRGLTLERFVELLDEQGGGCAICGGLNANGRHLAVDHSHRCEHKEGFSCRDCVRGLLCVACNTAIHKMDNDVDWHLKALAYLKKHGAQGATRDGRRTD